MAYSSMSDGATMSSKALPDKPSQAKVPFKPMSSYRQPASIKPAAAPTTNYQFNSANFDGANPYAGSNYSLMPEGASFDESLQKLSTIGNTQNLSNMSTADKMAVANQAMGTIASGAATIESQTKGQAVTGALTTGLSAGMTAATMIGADAAATAAAGGVATMSTAGALAATGIGAVVAAGVLAAGLNSAKQAKNRAEDEQKKREKQLQKAEEIRLLSTYQSRRDQAMANLASAFRRR